MERFGINICIWNGKESYLIYFTIYLVWNWLPLLEVLVFDSGIFDLARGWFGMLFSRVGVVSSVVPISFILRVGKIPTVELCLPEGGILAAESGWHVLSSWKNLINGAVKQELWEGKIPIVELELRVGEIPHRSNMDVRRRTPPSEKSPILIKVQGSVVVVRCTQACNITY